MSIRPARFPAQATAAQAAAVLISAARTATVLTAAALVLFASVAAAHPVDEPTARGVAESFLHASPNGAAAIEPGPPMRIDAAGSGPDTKPAAPLAYLFRATPRGWVVVAADDQLPPVVAYALEEAATDDLAPGPPLRRLLAADLDARLRAMAQVEAEVRAERARQWSALRSGIPSHAGRERFQQWPPAGSTPTGGWLLSNWTQNAPYNALCPLDLAHGGTRSLAGCPAVAMAMILNYHATVQATSLGSGDRYWHAYAGNNYWIPDAATTYGFPDFPTLNGYLATLTAHWGSGTPLTNTDKAALTFACGVAATQVFSASGSGTFGVDQAYEAYQRFAFAGSRLAFDSDPELYSDLALGMQQALPAHLAVVDPGWTMGHNVVIDGWNTDNYFHLNFGWGGAYNGWYLLPSEIPYGLTVIEGVVLDIVPSSTGIADPSNAGQGGATLAYPTPARERVALRLDSSLPRDARATTHDGAGRLVRCLAAAPDGTIEWRADDDRGRRVAPGVYFARVGAGAPPARIVICR